MAKFFHEEIEDILNEPFNGHPSNRSAHDIEQIKKALVHLAKNAPYGRI